MGVCPGALNVCPSIPSMEENVVTAAATATTAAAAFGLPSPTLGHTAVTAPLFNLGHHTESPVKQRGPVASVKHPTPSSPHCGAPSTPPP